MHAINRLFRVIGNYPYIVGLVGTLVASMVVVLAFGLMANGKMSALNHARETSENLNSIIALDTERNGRLYSTQLQAIVAHAETPRLWQISEALRNQVLFRELPENAYVDGQFVVDENGRIVASLQAGRLPSGVTLNDRNYFTVHQHNPQVGLFVSHPIQSRLSEGKNSIVLSRRINKPDQSFGGIAFFTIRLEFFQKVFNRLNTNESGSVAIILADGTILARKPFTDADVGQTIAGLPVFKDISSRPRGTVFGLGLDGKERMFTYSHVPGLNMITIVAPSVERVVNQWHEQTRITEIVTVALGLVMTLGAWALAFTLRDKLRTQDQLTRLATTDALTRLNNRRVLEQQLARSWEDAQSDQQFLSVLFIDIDYFKSYNDINGHAEGDIALTRVARCIDQVARDQNDVTARYGGEEFVVVLSGTDSETAGQVAETIRGRVQALAIINQASPTGLLTVSIGCASYQPGHGGPPEKLLSFADQQLYRAKSLGRNRVCAIALDRETFSRTDRETIPRTERD